MNIEEIRNICLSLPGTTEDIKWEDHLCFNVGEKMFVVTSPDSVPQTASFKVTDELFDELTAIPGITPAQYLARYKWVFVNDVKLLSQADWDKYIRLSYQLISSKLPGKVKKQLGI